jgi:hypothetical protein
MEDPMTFDVWGRIESEGRNDAVLFLLNNRTETWELNARVIVNKAINDATLIRVLSSVGWLRATELRQSPPPWLKNATVVEQSSLPDNPFNHAGNFCPYHTLFYGGWKCCVCSGFYIK